MFRQLEHNHAELQFYTVCSITEYQSNFAEANYMGTEDHSTLTRLGRYNLVLTTIVKILKLMILQLYVLLECIRVAQKA